MRLGTAVVWTVSDTRGVVAAPQTAIPAAAATLGPVCGMQAGAQNRRQPSLASLSSTDLLHRCYCVIMRCRIRR